MQRIPPWHGFDTLLSESKAESVDICIHINNKTVQYKYKDSVCVYVCVYSCKWCEYRTRVCVCVPVLGQDMAGKGRRLEVKLSLPHLVEERGVKLGLQLLVAVALDDLRYFLLPPHVRRVVQVTFQALPSAHVDDRLAHKKP